MGVRIAIIGTGYVGLVTGACFAELGHDVVCVDNNAEKVALLMQGVMPIYEPALDQLMNRNFAGKRIAIFGLTFKGQTDDMRDSPSLDIVPQIMGEGASVAAFDPAHPHDAKKLLPGIELCATAMDAVEGADLLVVLTDWMVFQTYDLGVFSPRMRTPALLDLRNLYSSKSVRDAGFARFENLGRVHDWYNT